MLYYEEFEEAIQSGQITSDTVQIVRRDGKIVDYVLPGEPVRPWEVVSVEPLDKVIEELSKHQEI